MKIVWCLVMLVLGLVQTASAMTFAPFGELVLRGKQETPRHVVILFSDSSGWGRMEEEIAKVLAAEETLVIGVDTAEYLAEIARIGYEANVSRELEGMNKYVQKNLNLPVLSTPAIMGFGGGAAIVYANLVQAPQGSFNAGLSLGFRPELPLSHPFTCGRGLTWQVLPRGVRFDAVAKFELPWTVVQAEKDTAFSAAAVRNFIQGMRGVLMHELPGTAQYDVDVWSSPVRDWVRKLPPIVTDPTSSQAEDIAELPLIEVPASGPASDSLAIFVTGDGGWAGIDKDIAAILAKNGIGVVGLDSLRYFWTKRTPEGGGEDLARIMKHYLTAWNKKRVIFIGFSLGADALPPMAATLPADLKKTIRQVTLLAPSKHVELEFHITDWMHDDDVNQDIALLPEVRKLEPVPMLCVYGLDEEASLCSDLSPNEATIKSLPGSHHFNGEFAKVAELILEHLKEKAR